MSCVTSMIRIGMVWKLFCTPACESGRRLNVGPDADAGMDAGTDIETVTETDTDTQNGGPESQLAAFGDDGSNWQVCHAGGLPGQ